MLKKKVYDHSLNNIMFKTRRVTRIYKVRLSLHKTRQVAHLKRLGVFLLPPGWDGSTLQGYPPSNLPVHPVYTSEWKRAP